MKILLAGIVSLLLCGCTPPIKSGIVQSKKFTPEHIRRHTEYTKIGDVKIPRVVKRTIPDEWTITIRGENDDGKMRERTFEVSRSQYDQAVVGEMWPRLQPVEK